MQAFIKQGEWDREMLGNTISEEMVDHIISSIKSPSNEFAVDVALWGNAQGNFIVKSAWELMRQKKEQRRDFGYI